MDSLARKFYDNRNPNSVSTRLRKLRFQKFLNYVNVTTKDKILDVGGTPDIWLGTGLERNVTLLNISFSDPVPSPFKFIIGDARNLPFDNKEFDTVFSNSVIEHVGNYDDQLAFASELQRVAKKYWVQTPNKYFIIEPHYVFPFFYFLPYFLQKIIASNWKYGHLYKNLEEIKKIRLLSQKEMKKLFPDSTLYFEKYLAFNKSIIAYKK